MAFLRWRIALAPNVPVDVLGDQNRLRQVLLNLIGNAIKFTSTGEVSVSVAATTGATRGIQFQVRNTGIGLPVSQQHYVFEAFAQSDGSITREHGDTGLGFAISSQLVQLMGGRLDLESTEGVGSTFRFTVEMDTPEGSAAPVISPEPGFRGLPILVMTPNRTSREMIAEMLESWGARPGLADSTDAASILLEHAAAAGEPFRLLLLDHRPPERAAALVAFARNHPGFVGEIVVMLGATEVLRMADMFRSLQVRHPLTRPVLSNQLLDTLHKVLEPDAVGPVIRAGPEAASGKDSTASLRVLVAEDNPTNQLLVSRALSKLGHRPQIAANGREASTFGHARSSMRFDGRSDARHGTNGGNSYHPPARKRVRQAHSHHRADRPRPCQLSPGRIEITPRYCGSLVSACGATGHPRGGLCTGSSLAGPPRQRRHHQL